MSIKLKEFKPSTRKGKKYMVVLKMNDIGTQDGKTKTVHFGAKGYEDFSIHRDPKRRQQYIARHKKNENWTKSGIDTAGFWSYWLLWGPTTNINENIKIVKKKFDL